MIGHAPAPGAVRVFQPGDLRMLAARHGLVLDASQPVCFEWPMAPLNREEVERAMSASLGDGQIVIVTLSQYPVPHTVPRGEVVFPRQSLGSVAGSDGTITWKGYVTYASSRKFDIWARVKIAMPQTRIVLKEAVPAGLPISIDNLTVDRYEGLPAAKTLATRVEEVAGRIPKKALPAGAVVPLNLLDVAKAIAKGDLVEVDVRVGAMRLRGAGKAVSAGAVGTLISVENIESKRTFTARVEAPGKVVVER